MPLKGNQGGTLWRQLPLPRSCWHARQKFKVLCISLILFFSWWEQPVTCKDPWFEGCSFLVPRIYLRRTNCECMSSIDWSSAPWLRNNECKLLNGWHLHLNTSEHAICCCPEICHFDNLIAHIVYFCSYYCICAFSCTFTNTWILNRGMFLSFFLN